MTKTKKDVSDTRFTAIKSPLDAVEEMYEARFGALAKRSDVNQERFSALANRKADRTEIVDSAQLQSTVITNTILLATAFRPN